MARQSVISVQPSTCAYTAQLGPWSCGRLSPLPSCTWDKDAESEVRVLVEDLAGRRVVRAEVGCDETIVVAGSTAAYPDGLARVFPVLLAKRGATVVGELFERVCHAGILRRSRGRLRRIMPSRQACSDPPVRSPQADRPQSDSRIAAPSMPVLARLRGISSDLPAATILTELPGALSAGLGTRRTAAPAIGELALHPFAARHAEPWRLRFGLDRHDCIDQSTGPIDVLIVDNPDFGPRLVDGKLARTAEEEIVTGRCKEWRGVRAPVAGCPMMAMLSDV